MEILDWESLRNNEEEEHYYLPYTKENYLLKVDTKEPNYLTQIIIKEIEETGLKKIFSIGSGIASQEYQLKKFSDYSVVVSDNNYSVLRLKQFEVFDDVMLLNVFKDTIPVDQNWIMLFPRIDTEFDDYQLSVLFAKCNSLGVKYILFIPAELLNIRILLAEIKTFLYGIIRKKKLVFCGYARSIGSFRKIWNPYYKLSKKYRNGRQLLFLRSN